MNRKKGVIATISLLAAVVAASLVRCYYIESDEVTEVVFNDRECTIFVSQTDFGWSLNYLQYVGRVTRGLVGGANPATARRSRLWVIQVTDSGVYRQELSEEHRFGRVDEGFVYIARGNEFWKLLDGRLEKADERVQERLLALRVPSSPQFSNFNGWSKQYLQSRTHNSVPCGSGKIVAITGERGNIRRIELATGAKTQQLYSLDTAMARVDQATYTSRFER